MSKMAYGAAKKPTSGIQGDDHDANKLTPVAGSDKTAVQSYGPQGAGGKGSGEQKPSKGRPKGKRFTSIADLRAYNKKLGL